MFSTFYKKYALMDALIWNVHFNNIYIDDV